ncbi:MAG: D-sedoheptulose 7-phosphate isomerase [Alphaproteobacteria bacterium]|nr:D-sedoheptulose 7-phosphate isomerase [Alphaproteobacteria bacterium]OJV15359.1 MAG: phosphoheptose isomerase [Alphaproteobacteria bacterium 33-17]
MNHAHTIKEQIAATSYLINQVAQSEEIINTASQIADEIIASLEDGGKIIFAGNGGSAADSQHLAAEFVSKLCTDRNPLPGIAITTDTSAITAIGNDYGYEQIFARQLQAIGKSGDIFFAITTSGNSKNIIEAIKVAKKMGIKVIGLTGATGGAIANMCDYIIKIPSPDTAKVQECHIMIGHIICMIVENFYLAKENHIELQSVGA